MNVISLDPNMVDDSDRLRPVDMAWAEKLADAMREEGQLQPIEVQPAGADGRHKLTIGAHRLAACRILGRPVLAIVNDVEADRARLREIDENFYRHELNDLDRAIFVGERLRLWESIHGVRKAKKSEQNQRVAGFATVAFTDATARQMHVAQRTVRLLMHRYRNLSPEVQQMLRGTWVARSGAELDALARLSPAEQLTVAKMLLRKDDPQPSVRLALAMVRGLKPKPADDADTQFSRLVMLWGKAPRDVKERFRAFISRESANEARRAKQATKEKDARAAFDAAKGG